MQQRFDISKLPPHIIALRQEAQRQLEESKKYAIFPLSPPTPALRQRTRLAILSCLFLRTFNGKELAGIRYGMWNGFGFLRESSPYSDRFRRISHVSSGHESRLWKFCSLYWSRPLSAFCGFDMFCWLRDLESEQETEQFLDRIYFFHNLHASGQSRASKLELINGVIMKPSDKIPAEIMEQLTMELASLEKALLEKDPMMKVHLQKSHRLIQDYPETVNLLEDHEIAKIIDGLELHTKTEIVKVGTKPAAAGRRAAKVSIDDL